MIPNRKALCDWMTPLEAYTDYLEHIEKGTPGAKEEADIYFRARQCEALERIADVLEWYQAGSSARASYMQSID